MKIGAWGKTDFFINNFNKNKMQLNFQMSRLTLTIQFLGNFKDTKSDSGFHCAQL